MREYDQLGSLAWISSLDSQFGSSSHVYEYIRDLIDIVIDTELFRDI